ncbi:phosphomannomutase/phosphoglucomutase [Candidatus Kaiserbacteria bacterium CG10_big_fil_rev_8_21_14_0_10_59_10]|uniref:Phosphomannomutase/phosphoglucomutase n=1 Tax=Candidatus Kaiserbacteria bacterium CG10_big_fil_rev_8_21_14_0_10_59_10 TaxID=1974612 RepID=A0A2H0U7E8_9BACT|nr:MAG: phosphomannomutase/phosphoglucomutase [Candidatus Kaiserbacteria bacterium CG10_big_fil_rev_8_21_14_0_10_59_10]
MHPNPSIFKAYDIRGVHPSDINADVSYAIGRGYATLLLSELPAPPRKIAVSGDMRLSTPELKEALIRGITDTGLAVDDIGMLSTPTFYAAVGLFKYDGGVQVSASHNPKEYNGFKLVRAEAVPISGDSGIQTIRAIIETDAYAPLAETKGSRGSRSDVTLAVLEDQLSRAAAARAAISSLKVAIDPGNGVGALDMQALFARLPCEVVWMNETPDGTFPAHPADPMLEENTRQLRERVAAEKCDVGIGIDGDGDRYFFFDEKGEVVPPAILRGLLAQIELAEHPHATIVYDTRPGRITTELIEEAGGRAIMAPVGHSLIKEAMLANGAVFGAESSGHFFYRLPYGTFEAPVLTVVKFLAFVSQGGKPLSELIAPYRRFHSSGEVNVRLQNRSEGAAAIERIKKAHRDARQHTLDGLSVEYPEYWFNVRLSNTEPLLRLTVESPSPNVTDEKRKELMALIESK